MPDPSDTKIIELELDLPDCDEETAKAAFAAMAETMNRMCDSVTVMENFIERANEDGFPEKHDGSHDAEKLNILCFQAMIWSFQEMWTNGREFDEGGGRCLTFKKPTVH